MYEIKAFIHSFTHSGEGAGAFDSGSLARTKQKSAHVVAAAVRCRLILLTTASPAIGMLSSWKKPVKNIAIVFHKEITDDIVN